MASGELLWDHVRRRDFDGLAELLPGLSPHEHAEALVWYRDQATQMRRYYSRDEDYVHGQQSTAWTESLLAAHLAPPVAAAERVRWNDLYQHQEEEYLGRLVAALLARGKEWATHFVPRASSARITGSGAGWWSVTTLFHVLQPLVRGHQLEVPAGDAYVHGWMTADFHHTQDWLDAQEWSPPLLRAAIAHPSFGSNPLLVDAVPVLVSDGVLTRHDTLEQVLGLLTTPGRVSVQRTLCRVLVGLGCDARDLTGRLPLVQGLIATCHGTVGAFLLPAAIALCETPDDVVELCTTVAGRPEHKQKTDLVKALGGPQLRARVGTTAVLDGLDLMAAGADASLHRAVGTARARVAPDDASPPPAPDPAPGAAAGADDGVGATGANGVGSAAVPTTLERDLPPAGFAFREFRTFELAAELVRGEVRCTEGPRDVGHRQMPWRPPVVLSLLFRWIRAEGPDAVRSSLTDLVMSDSPSSRTAIAVPVQQWVAGELTPETFRAAVRASRLHFAAARGDLRRYESVEPLAVRHVQETLLRAGRSPVLLSTPSHQDGTLGFDDLKSRLHECAGTSFGPLDLLLTLMRLRPTDPSRAVELDGWPPLPPDDLLPEEPCGIRDAVAFLRQWVADGGLRPLRVKRFPDPAEAGGHDWHSELPLPLERIPTCPPEPLAHDYSHAVRITRLPTWPPVARPAVRPRHPVDPLARLAEPPAQGPPPRRTPRRHRPRRDPRGLHAHEAARARGGHRSDARFRGAGEVRGSTVRGGRAAAGGGGLGRSAPVRRGLGAVPARGRVRAGLAGRLVGDRGREHGQPPPSGAPRAAATPHRLPARHRRPTHRVDRCAGAAAGARRHTGAGGGSHRLGVAG